METNCMSLNKKFPQTGYTAETNFTISITTRTLYKGTSKCFGRENIKINSYPFQIMVSYVTVSDVTLCP